MILLDIYIIVALIVTIFFIVLLRTSGNDFDKFVHDATGGQVEFTWLDKILVPVAMGITWPYGFYKILRVMVHG